VDVYVNGVPPDFDLSRIPSSKLCDAAGSAMEAECKKKFSRGLKVGDIADTGGYNAKCQRMYHVTLPKSQSDGSQNQVKVYDTCTVRYRCSSGACFTKELIDLNFGRNRKLFLLSLYCITKLHGFT
jgi:hypothetical protein